MTALKGEAISRFLKRPDKPVVLVYGPDTGLVGERSRDLIEIFLGPDADPMARAVIEGDSLGAAPHLLAEEAHSVPMFGGKRAVRVTSTTKNIVKSVEPLLSDPPSEALVVIEAGDLKPSSPVRKAVEKAAGAVALPCYVDDKRALETLILDELGAASLRPSPDARAALLHLLGGDRLASRGELKKLALYCQGREHVDLDDVSAVVGDASALELDTLIDATALGDATSADRMLAKALSAGSAPPGILSALGRHFLQLNLARQKIDRGATADAAMRDLRPPVFFKRQNAFRRQLGYWSPEAIGRALDLISGSEGDIRLRPDLAEAMLGRILIMLATAARQAGRR